MFECQICGLLSLGGTACPACGSQLRTDLSASMDDSESLPTEVPGLDEAAEAWYDLEGIEPPQHDSDVGAASEGEGSTSALPFGFQGTSNVYDSRLPFGIGSSSEGIPFDGALVETMRPMQSEIPQPSSAESVASEEEPPRVKETVPEALVIPPVESENQVRAMPDLPQSPPEAANTASVDAVPEASEPPAPPAAPPVVPGLPPAPPAAPPVALGLPPAPPTTPPVAPGLPPAPPATPPVAPGPPPAPPAPAETMLSNEPVRLSSARLVQSAPVVQASPVQDEATVPEYWRIDAPIPNYEEIYSHSDEVVEMEYTSMEDDVVVFDHETDSPAAVFHSPLEASPVSKAQPSVALDLHPVQALSVDTGGSADLQSLVANGFSFMQSGDWSSAARAFQRLAASLPNSPAVFNNYGISLLQRALSMQDGPADQQSMAESQFESSILALREAAKNAPSDSDVLVNLASALIHSGRAEKALGIMNVHNARSPDSAKGLNTAAVAMFKLGQLTQATETLERTGGDPVASKNLAKLMPSRTV